MVKRIKINGVESSKIKSDLKFLQQFIEFSNKHQFRPVVSGGYGLDGILHTITRPHNDIDIIVYGKLPREKAVQLIKEYIRKLFPKAQFSGESNLFFEDVDINTSGFGCNLYFVETVDDPHKDINRIIRSDGQIQINSEKRFPPPVKASLEGIDFEAQNPNLHLADILAKRKKQTNESKHDIDIANLRKITDTKFVESLLEQY